MPDLVDLYRLMKKFQNSEPSRMHEISSLMDVVADDEFCLINSGVPMDVRSRVEHYRAMTPYERCREFLEGYLKDITQKGTTDGRDPKLLVYQNLSYEIQHNSAVHSDVSIKVWTTILEEFRQSHVLESK